jgi:hypothetical protein
MRILLVLSLAIFASSLVVASDNPADSRAASERRPSKFDYLVLASIADSRQLFPMAGYHGTGNQPPEAAAGPSCITAAALSSLK